MKILDPDQLLTPEQCRRLRAQLRNAVPPHGHIEDLVAASLSDVAVHLNTRRVEGDIEITVYKVVPHRKPAKPRDL